MRIIDLGDEFHISWAWDHWHQRNLDAVKALPLSGRRYVSDVRTGQKYWWVSGHCREEVMRLKINHKAQLIVPGNLRPEVLGDEEPLPELDNDIPIRGKLRPYQRQGVAAMMKYKRILNGDEQGLGKTIQAIGAVVGLDKFPCIVICPASTKYNWQREWHRFSGEKAIVLDSRMTAQQRLNWQRYVADGTIRVVIVNYESIGTFFIESYPDKKGWGAKDVALKPCMELFKTGILDESHKCKDPHTHQSRFVLRMFVGLENRFLLSGTPVVNKPRDLWSQLAIMGKLHLFGGKEAFLDRYCEGGKGAENLHELNYLLKKQGCFFRREKREVAGDLPEKQRQTIICDITNRSEYNRAVKNLKEWLATEGFSRQQIDKKMAGEALLRINILRQISARGKVREVLEFTREVLEAGEKLILFCTLTCIVDELLAAFPGAVTVTGRDSASRKQANIDAFQNRPECRLIICNIRAAGTGITLTASSRVAFAEYPFTYADCIQCEDRCHRIGVKNTVMCTYFNGKDTIDEWLWEIIMEKRHIVNTIMGAEDEMETEVVNKLIDLLK